ncbi:MAG TPA: VOC family protein [Mesorhizobium sp.]|jgi:catechol 2,3-dioxygenase-like lactoylglutathione lyase family enzyme|nr:VOC family protein [Mesorhizobium sp.]
MNRRLATVALLVRDYDEAVSWFVEKLGFRLLADDPQGDGRRWVVVGPESGAALLLARAADEAQAAMIGRQGGGRVFLFLETDDFLRDHAGMVARGVEFREEPRHEAYGTVAVFFDLCGNSWDLIQPRR